MVPRIVEVAAHNERYLPIIPVKAGGKVYRQGGEIVYQLMPKEEAG